MIDALPPALVLLLGALAIPLLPGRLRQAWMVLLPLAGLANLLALPLGTHFTVSFQGYSLVLGEVDRLSRVFGIIFHLVAFIGGIYGLAFRNTVEHVAGFLYAGCALGAVFAGDLITLFFFWEALTICALPLILARRSAKSLGAAVRYTLVHAAGGLILLAGIVIHSRDGGGSFAFGQIGLESLGGWLIFLGFGVNCAWPLVHSWLVDAYPEATVGGAVLLSAFTTKTAVYALARAFPGEVPLIWIGTVMAAFPVFFALIENDLRRVLAYSILTQVGFMVVGIGIGTELAINGAVAHAFNDVLFKGLLFMSVGAVLHRTGTSKATDLGGLGRSMPLTALFCIVGAASLCAFPLFNGFVSKSLILSAAAHEGFRAAWFVLLFAAAGALAYIGIKVPYFAFFGRDAGLRVREAPAAMLVAMGLAALLCVFIGSFPSSLYSLLPYAVEYQPYTFDHVLSQLQLLCFSALAFTLLLLSGVYPAMTRALTIDADWLYRKGGAALFLLLDRAFNGLNAWADQFLGTGLASRLSAWFADGPARACLLVARPIWELTGVGAAGAERLEERFLAKFRAGFFSVGSTGVLVLGALLVLFLL